MRGESPFYTARYRNADGVVVEVGTRCRDETAARQVLADLVKRSERVRAGLITSAEDAMLNHRTVPIAEHVQAYLEHLRNKRVCGRRVSPHHCVNVEHNVSRIVRDCGFSRLSDLARPVLERWLNQREVEGMSARTRNAHLAAFVAFCNWCVESHRMLANPVNRMPKANEKMDRRRQRRAMTETDLARLLEAARNRPLLDATTIRRGQRKGQAVGRLSDETRRRLEELGLERALIYKTLLLTGLRKSELASLTVSQLVLHPEVHGVAYAILSPEDEKSGRGAEIPLRPDLVSDLVDWLEIKRKRVKSSGGTSVAALPPSTPVFTVPEGLIRIFDLDLVAAGLARRVQRQGKWIIDKRDDRGRTLDVHSLRHSFASHLSRGGVAPRTAQAAMRHSTLALTMSVYTDPRLLDVAGALEALPALPITGTGNAKGKALRASG